MELALNLLWALLAATSYALLFHRLARSKVGITLDPARVPCVVALTCLLAILFPVISLSDDLHELQAAVEEAVQPVPAIKQCVSGQSLCSGRTHSPIFWVASSRPNAFQTVSLGTVFRLHTDCSLSGFKIFSRDRSPPVDVLARLI